MLENITRKIQKNFLRVLLFLAFAVGILYVFLIPPWRHYDEPGHFEFAWLVAHQAHWPKEGDYDLQMRRDVAASMIEHDFYRNAKKLPDLTSDEPPYISLSQMRHMPLYYFLASLPLRITRQYDVAVQLYFVRLISLFFFVITIYFVYKICCELFPAGHPMRWMVPIFLACLPPFVDLMTAVNNDVTATAFTTFFFWACLRLILDGPKPVNFLWVILGCGLSVLSKNTAFFVLPLLVIVILLALLRKRPGLAWGIIGCLAGITILSLFSWGNPSPAFFYSTSDEFLPGIVKITEAPLGNYAFAQRSVGNYPQRFFFMIPIDELTKLRGKTITLGVWAWASEPLDVASPALQLYKTSPKNNGNFHIDTKPHYYTFSYRVPKQTSLGWFFIFASERPSTTIYWDGWVLTNGDFLGAEVPVFSNDQATSGIWKGIHFKNIIHNPSGETVWPVLRPIPGRFLAKMGLTSSFLWSWMDLRGVGWYYRATADKLFQTFWGKFGWADVLLAGKRPFIIFYVLCILSGVGLIASMVMKMKYINWTIVAFLGLAWLISLAMVFARGLGSWLEGIYLPNARYTYPAISITSMLLCSGWYGLADMISPHIRFKLVWKSLFLIGLVVYNIWALYSLIQYYYLYGV